MTDHPVHTEPASAQAQAAAERRRRTLRRLMAQHNMPPAELARRIGMPTPNSIYNFLSGRSSGLSHQNLERIIAVFPGDDALELVAAFRPVAPLRDTPSNRAVARVMLAAHAGLWGPSVLLPEEAQFKVPYPGGFIPVETDLFAVLVTEPGDEHLHPIGSILICSPVEGTTFTMRSGVKIVTVTKRSNLFEVSLRKVPDDRNADWFRNALAWRDWPYNIARTRRWPKPNRSGDSVVRIAGLVTAAWQPDWSSRAN